VSTVEVVEVTMTVNGEERTLRVEPRTLLVHALRDELDLTGTKISCDASQCDSGAASAITGTALLVDGGTVPAAAAGTVAFPSPPVRA
jgi:aerobic-type carbon monoxide dehydrogenase small subunit (CoxS/CutS family)